MNSKVISNIAVLVGCLAAVFSGTAAQAQNTASLAVTANIDSSATLTLSDTSGIASTLTFGGAGNETVAASEGAITVSARLSTTQGNTGTVIQIRCSDLTVQSIAVDAQWRRRVGLKIQRYRNPGSRLRWRWLPSRPHRHYLRGHQKRW